MPLNLAGATTVGDTLEICVPESYSAGQGDCYTPVPGGSATYHILGAPKPVLAAEDAAGNKMLSIVNLSNGDGRNFRIEAEDARYNDRAKINFKDARIEVKGGSYVAWSDFSSYCSLVENASVGYYFDCANIPLEPAGTNLLVRISTPYGVLTGSETTDSNDPGYGGRIIYLNKIVGKYVTAITPTHGAATGSPLTNCVDASGSGYEWTCTGGVRRTVDYEIFNDTDVRDNLVGWRIGGTLYDWTMNNLTDPDVKCKINDLGDGSGANFYLYCPVPASDGRARAAVVLEADHVYDQGFSYTYDGVTPTPTPIIPDAPAVGVSFLLRSNIF
jgi:hypothetical protein